MNIEIDNLILDTIGGGYVFGLLERTPIEVIRWMLILHL